MSIAYYIDANSYINAKYWEKGPPRNIATTFMLQLGLKHRKEKSGYHECSLAETGVCRFKQLTGDKLNNHTFISQHKGEIIKAKAFNTMNRLGMPENH
ncbi:hypothetical protein JL49_24020 [Pseudoalteromonas luteoviolacea]|nr:hypothetical protein JL49_24020 [Pseudoalteromonas luteoviolacea]